MSKVMTIRPPENLQQAIKAAATEKGYTVNQLVLQILWAWVKENNKEGTI